MAAYQPHVAAAEVVTVCYTCCHWVRSLVMATAVWRVDMRVTQGTVTQLIATDRGVSSVHAGRQLARCGFRWGTLHAAPRAGRVLGLFIRLCVQVVR